jgi:hypothetical protein
LPRGPKGEKRPADVIGNAVRVMQIATGGVEETPPMRSRSPAILFVVALAVIGAPIGGHASAQSYKASYYSKDDFYSLSLLAGDEIEAMLFCKKPDDDLGPLRVSFFLPDAPGTIESKGSSAFLNGREVPLALDLKIDGSSFKAAKVEVFVPNEGRSRLRGDFSDQAEAVLEALRFAETVEFTGDGRTLTVDVSADILDSITMVDGCKVIVAADPMKPDETVSSPAPNTPWWSRLPSPWDGVAVDGKASRREAARELGDPNAEGSMGPDFDDTAKRAMATVYSRGLVLCREHAEENGGDRKEAVFNHFREQLRLGLLLRLIDIGMSPDEAEETIVEVIQIAELR